MPLEKLNIENTLYPIMFSCADMLLHDKKCILMIRKKDRDKLYLPGGFRDVTDATTHHTAARELKEEVGIDVERKALVRIGEFITVDGHRYNPKQSKHRLSTTLFCLDTDKQFIDLDTAVAGDDALAVEKVTFEQLHDIDWVINNIVDGHIPLIFASLPYIEL